MRSVPLGEVMALFWIVHEIDGERRIFIQEAHALIFARLKAAIAGFDDGVFVEAHMLDAKTASFRPGEVGPPGSTRSESASPVGAWRAGAADLLTLPARVFSPQPGAGAAVRSQPARVI